MSKSLSQLAPWELRIDADDSRRFELRAGGTLVAGTLRGKVHGLARRVQGRQSADQRFRTTTSTTPDSRAAGQLVDRIGDAIRGKSDGILITQRMSIRAETR